MLNHQHIVLRSLLIGLVSCLFYGCNGVSEQSAQSSADPGMSPVRIEVADIHPWIRAQQIAEVVPNSDVMVGHGGSMLPLYPDGTVLVVQRLQLDHLRSGMTVVYHTGGDVYWNLRAEILVKPVKADFWETAVSDKQSEHRLKRLNDDNYIGTVVAALARASEEQKIVDREFLVNTSNLYCTTQCHVAGEVHPRVVPGIQPKVTTFDLNKDY